MAYYCPHCLAEVNQLTGTCPVCGQSLEHKNLPYMLRVGSLLNGRYVIGKSLGKGGFGIAYLGLDTKLRKYVAVKEFYPSSSVSRDTASGNTVRMQAGTDEQNVLKWKRRFYEEAQNLARFAGEAAIVTVHDYFQENNTAYIIMEYIRGVNLKEYIGRYGVLSFDQAYRLLRPVMLALQKIHNAGLIHRDIGPTNIMIQEDGTPKLMDFGTARYYGEINNRTTVVLSPGYAPLEQYQGTSNQGPWTDVYAICATLYYLITGSPPTNALARIGNEQLPAPSRKGAAISAVQEAVLLKGLSVDVPGRYQNMADLIRAFDGAPQQSGLFSGMTRRNKRNLTSQGSGGTTGSSRTGGTTGFSGIGGTTDSSGTGGMTGSSGTGGMTGSSGTGGMTGSSRTGGMTGSSGIGGTTGSSGTMGTTGTYRLDLGETTGVSGQSGTAGSTGSPGPAIYRGSTGVYGGQSFDQSGNNGRKGLKTTAILGIVAGAACIVLLVSIMSLTGVFGRKGSRGVNKAHNVGVGSTSYQSEADGDNNDNSPDSGKTSDYVDMDNQKSGDQEGQSATREMASATVQTDNVGTVSPFSSDDYAVDWKDDMLKSAVVEATSIRDRDIMYSDIENITELRIPNYGIRDISALAEMKNLSYLDLSGNSVSDISALAELEYLEWLSLEGNPVASLQPLSSLTRLKQLYLVDMGIKDIGPLKGLTNLKTLELRYNQIQDISALSGLEQLEILDLQANEISDLGPLEGLWNLSALGLTSNNITDVRPLQYLFSLTELYLGDNMITDIDGILLLLSLQTLDLSYNMISDVSDLYLLSELVALDLSYNNVSDVTFLGELYKLEFLDLTGNPVTDLSPLDNLRNVTIYVD